MMMNDAEALKQLVKMWYETRAWAEEFLCEKLRLKSAQQILEPKYRGCHQIQGTPWSYRTHGLGVDLSQPGNVGGIDFNFEIKTPDAGLLREFLIKQYNAGALPKRIYRPLLHDEQRFLTAASLLPGP